MKMTERVVILKCTNSLHFTSDKLILISFLDLLEQVVVHA